jgi:hypothetical protein
MEKFEHALKRISTVAKEELDERVAGARAMRERTRRKPGPKPSSASDHASGA